MVDPAFKDNKESELKEIIDRFELEIYKTCFLSQYLEKRIYGL